MAQYAYAPNPESFGSPRDAFAVADDDDVAENRPRGLPLLRRLAESKWRNWEKAEAEMAA